MTTFISKPLSQDTSLISTFLDVLQQIEAADQNPTNFTYEWIYEDHPDGSSGPYHLYAFEQEYELSSIDPDLIKFDFDEALQRLHQ